MIYVYIIIAGVAGFFGSVKLGHENSAFWFFLGTPAILLATFLARLFYFGIKDTVEEMNQRESEYKAALDWLQAHPSDPQARIRALEAGRAFYVMEIPDTVTKVNGRAIDRTDNTASREAKIAADIEARISHHRIAS